MTNNFQNLSMICTKDIRDIEGFINERLKHMSLDLRLTKFTNDEYVEDLDFLTQSDTYKPKDVKECLKEYQSEVKGNKISIAIEVNNKFHQIDIIFVKNIDKFSRILIDLDVNDMEDEIVNLMI